jgi:UDP:flavonoid glycosyltransferase YjiC (YdhE family)
MRIAAVTFGTEGDSRPMVALCRGLIGAGHDVTLLAERSASTLAHDSGVPFEALAGDMAQELDAAARRLSQRGATVRRFARVLADIAMRNAGAWTRALLDQSVRADAVVGAGLAIYAALAVAEHRRIPVIGAGLQPVMPTGDFPSPFLPPWRLPAWANRASHRLVLALLWRAFRGSVNQARRDVLGEAPRRRQWRDYPVVVGVSPALVPPPSDWPPDAAITGYWWMPPDAAWRPDADLAAFLAAGAPPVYVGFGSMLGFDRARMQASVLDALDGRRAILSSGWSGFGAGPLPSSVMRIGHVPHEWLFPRMDVVVHHGGAGTTHAAALAGTASVVVPFAGDQPFWAERLRLAGIAPRPIAHRALTAEALADRLRRTDDADMRARARDVSRAMAGEDGVGRAIARIEAAVAAGPVMR